jgi:hypothetical protein
MPAETPSQPQAEHSHPQLERVDGVLLDTLGGKGSVITGALAGAGVGLAVADIPGTVLGLLVGAALGAVGAVGRSA